MMMSTCKRLTNKNLLKRGQTLLWAEERKNAAWQKWKLLKQLVKRLPPLLRLDELARLNTRCFHC